MNPENNTLTMQTPFSISSALSLAVPDGLILPPPVISNAILHEIRNPLTNINLAVEMCRETVTNDTEKFYLDIILRASQKINELITELVRQHQPDLGEMERYSIHQLLDEVLFMAADRLLIKKINVTKVYAARDYIKMGDRPGMKIGLTNIIINAIDSMNKEGRELRLVTQSLDGRYIIQVEDNGCGISKNNLKHIFKPYFTSKRTGLGVGLSVTQNIFKANKINIHVASEPGIGTKFTLTFGKEKAVISENKKGAKRLIHMKTGGCKNSISLQKV
jgi:signal transduction histidine kinase